MVPRNGWNSYQKLVLDKLDEHSESLKSLGDEMNSIRIKDVPALQVEIAMLKIKAGMWGAIAGMVPAALAVVYIWLQYGTYLSAAVVNK